MNAAKVFLDTGIFIAFLVLKDQYHRQALSLFGGPRPCWFTSTLVRAEGYSWFLHKHGEESARKFRFFLDSLEGLEIFDADANLHQETCRILDRLRGTRLTYVDASSLALMEQHAIKKVWATDHHLGLTGAEVLPQA